MMPRRVDEKGLLLRDLVEGLIDPGTAGCMLITGLTQDSREVAGGYLFLAMAGTRQHAMDHLEQAIEAGAAAVLAEPGGRWDYAALQERAGATRVPLMILPRLRQEAGRIAARFYGHPGQALRTIGVTGTNGKTSVTHFLAQALDARLPAAVVGTLGSGFVTALDHTGHTTPDAVRVHAELARLQALGAKVVAMEVSSHALDQYRVGGVPFHTVVYTNLSRDHQDYHGSMQAYAEAKGRLLRRAGIALAVVNADDPEGRRQLDQHCRRLRMVAVGRDAGALRRADEFVHIRQVDTHARGQSVQFDSSWGRGVIESGLLGDFNADNLGLCLAVLLGWGTPLERATVMLGDVQSVPGRMNRFGGQGQPTVVVDYAHTPDALEKALRSLRVHAAGRLSCVFGCGGDRDRGKRALMGGVAARLADAVVVTDDNPRTEDPEVIVADILQGVPAGAHCTVIHERARAIAHAIAEAGADDIVLVAGKGHEAVQVMGELQIPFSDIEQVQACLAGGEA